MTKLKCDVNRPAFKFFPKHKERILKGQCPICGEPIDLESFVDELSRKEFTLSGMCQKCQDEVFGASYWMV